MMMRAVVSGLVVMAVAVPVAAQPLDVHTDESARPAESPAPAVSPDIERSAEKTLRLAREGDCDLAAELGRAIEGMEPAYYQRVLATNASLMACLAKAPSASVRTSTEEGPATPVCRTASAYAEPTLLHMSNNKFTDGTTTSTTSGLQVVDRIAVGARLRGCSSWQRFGARIGGTGVLSSALVGPGVEAEADYGEDASFRIGLRVGLELTSNDRLATVGARLRIVDKFFVAFDAYEATQDGLRSRGVMFGMGLQGRAGRWSSVANVALVAAGALGILAAGPP